MLKILENKGWPVSRTTCCGISEKKPVRDLNVAGKDHTGRGDPRTGEPSRPSDHGSWSKPLAPPCRAAIWPTNKISKYSIDQVSIT